MSDLISREEVLNLIDTAFENGAFDGRYAYENLIDAVKNLIHPLETDLVSRQAEIDAADKIIERDISGSNAVVNAMIAWSEYIRTLPSVEPEKCGDCISRKALLKKLQKVATESWKMKLKCNAEIVWNQCIDYVKNALPVEQEKCNDCISREELKQKFQWLAKATKYGNEDSEQ